MKRIATIIIFCVASVTTAFSQSRAVGVRTNGSSFEFSYQGNLSSDVFYEADLGLDKYRDESGVMAEFVMNAVVARPAFTSKGDWSIYAGLGLAAGSVYDMSLSTFTYRDPYYGTRYTVHDRWGKGPMLGVSATAGISYAFDIPIKVSLDFRPILGLHKAERIHPDSDSNRLIGIYGAGIVTSYIPRLSVHYIF